MAGPGPTPADRASQFKGSMNTVNTVYRDAISTLAAITGTAQITQLGGMDLALESILEGGWMWITDLHDSLPWDRADHQGWWAGIYEGHMNQTEPGRKPIVWAEIDDTSMTALGQIVRSALAQFHR
jgi:hypothetical protein